MFLLNNGEVCENLAASLTNSASSLTRCALSRLHNYKVLFSSIISASDKLSQLVKLVHSQILATSLNKFTHIFLTSHLSLVFIDVRDILRRS